MSAGVRRGAPDGARPVDVALQAGPGVSPPEALGVSPLEALLAGAGPRAGESVPRAEQAGGPPSGPTPGCAAGRASPAAESGTVPAARGEHRAAPVGQPWSAVPKESAAPEAASCAAAPLDRQRPRPRRAGRIPGRGDEPGATTRWTCAADRWADPTGGTDRIVVPSCRAVRRPSIAPDRPSPRPGGCVHSRGDANRDRCRRSGAPHPSGCGGTSGIRGSCCRLSAVPREREDPGILSRAPRPPIPALSAVAPPRHPSSSTWSLTGDRREDSAMILIVGCM